MIEKGAAATLLFFVREIAGGVPGVGHTGITGFTAKISKDHGALASATNSVTEVANGFYKLVLTTTETNCQSLAVFIEESVTHSMGSSYEYKPGCFHLQTIPKWSSEVLGSSYNAGTDTFERIRNAMEQALQPIVRAT